MKKLLLITSLFIASLTVNAQIEGGTIMTGGSAFYNNNKVKNATSSTTSISVNPQFGVAFADNFIGGMWFEIGSFSEVSSWSVAPFVRYYTGNLFGQLGYGYNSIGGVGQSILDIEVGYAIFLNDYVALEPAFYYYQYFNNGLSERDLGFKLGFQIYFNR